MNERLNESPRMCERCQSDEPVDGERYCLLCREAVLEELDDIGYLTPLPPDTRQRGKNAREDVRATKFGID